MRRLVCAFVVRKPPKTGFLASRPKNLGSYFLQSMQIRIVKHFIRFEIFFDSTLRSTKRSEYGKRKDIHQSEPQPNPRNSVESDHGCTSRIFFDNAGDNVPACKELHTTQTCTKHEPPTYNGSKKELTPIECIVETPTRKGLGLNILYWPYLQPSSFSCCSTTYRYSILAHMRLLLIQFIITEKHQEKDSYAHRQQN